MTPKEITPPKNTITMPLDDFGRLQQDLLTAKRDTKRLDHVMKTYARATDTVLRKAERLQKIAITALAASVVIALLGVWIVTYGIVVRGFAL